MRATYTRINTVYKLLYIQIHDIFPVVFFLMIGVHFLAQEEMPYVACLILVVEFQTLLLVQLAPCKDEIKITLHIL